MIKSLYKIGSVIQEEYPKYFDPWGNPFPKNADTSKVIVIPVKDKKIVFPLQIEDFRQHYAKKYLYRKVQGANGTNLVPTFLFYLETKEERQKDNIRKVLKKVKASIKNQKHDFLKEDDINEELAEALFQLNLSKDNRYLLTFKLNGKYFGDFPANIELFEDEAYKKYSKDSSSKNKICSVTYKEVEEVWGRVDTLGFTVNDKSFNRNGFDGKDSYKMFPVSPDAVKILEGAKKFVLEKFSRNFYGMKYFVLPHFITANEEAIRKAIGIFVKDDTDIRLSQSSGKSIIGTEIFLHKIIEKKELRQGDIYYDIFFYQPNNAQFLIKLHLSDVLPSRLRKIFLTKESIEKKYYKINTIVIPKKGKTPEQAIPFYITFGEIKKFFSKKVKTDTVFHPYFFKILESVFYNNPLNEKQILTSFFQKIKIDFKNRNESAYQWQQSTKESFSIYQFFLKLNLFKNKNIMDNTTNQETVALNVFDFINQHEDFFNGNKYKKGIFMIACMTEKLLEKQRRKLDSEPFLKNLNGLNIDEKQIQKILPKLTDKINQYKKETNDKYKFYPNELKYIETLSAQSADGIMSANSGLNRTEMSYVFTLGMIMQKEFTKVQIAANKANKAKESEAK